MLHRWVIPAVILAFLACGAVLGQAETYKCAQCGKPIEGAHFQTHGLYYHPEHFRCYYCDQPITGGYTEYKDHNYHTPCFRDNVALRCDLCGDIIAGEYIQDYWGNAYHLFHKGNAPNCDSCSRFISQSITGGGVRYDDGRYICAICHPSSVTDIKEIIALIDEVAAHMEEFGMKVDYKGMKVHLVGREQLKDLAGEHSNALRGFTDYSERWRIFGKPQRRKLNMYLLYGMPRMELISTIAHELAHIWQFNHGRFENDRALSEGSCNYAAFMVLGKYPGQESSFFRNSMYTDVDSIYGDGFRRVKDYAEAAGTTAWLRHLRRKDHFPRVN